MSPLMMVPVLSAGIWPDTKTRPAALTAWDCVEVRSEEGGRGKNIVVKERERERQEGGKYIRANSWRRRRRRRTDIIVSEQESQRASRTND